MCLAASSILIAGLTARATSSMVGWRRRRRLLLAALDGVVVVFGMACALADG